MRPENLNTVFTLAELDVLMLLKTGASNKEIALITEKSDGAIKTHLKSINRKFGVTNRTQAAVKLWRILSGEDNEDAAWAEEFSGPQVLITWRQAEQEA